MSERYAIGGNWQPLSPNFAYFQVLPSPPTGSTGRSYFDTSLGIGVFANGIWNYAGGGGGGSVASVFGRTGSIAAQSDDYTFAQIGSKPTTIVGYGITDALSTASSLDWAKLINKPSTVQFMWIVGGNNNFSGLPGSPTPPIAGATTLVTSLLTGVQVRVCRGGFPLPNMNPGDGTMYYTKVTASNTLTFSTSLVTGELIIVETLPL